jgi:hypothetical protein
MSNEMKTQNIEDLRTQLHAAKRREHELARECDALPERIKEAARRVVKEKANAARRRRGARGGRRVRGLRA